MRALRSLAHHLVAPRADRLRIEESPPFTCGFCRQPLGPPYKSDGPELLHHHCAVERHVQKLEAKIDLLTKRLNDART